MMPVAYLGKEWAGEGVDRAARRAAGVPEDRAAAVVTKPELARRMFARALASGVPFTWACGDEVYGRCPGLRAWLEEHGVRYCLEVPRDQPFTLGSGLQRTAREL